MRMCSQKAEKDEFSCSLHCFLCIQLRTAAHGMMLPTVLVGHLWSSLRDSPRVFSLDRSKSRKCEKTLTWSLALQRNWCKRDTQSVHADRAYGCPSVSLWWFQHLEHRALSSWIWGADSELICSVKPVLDEETEELPDTSLQSLDDDSFGECPDSREIPPRSWFTYNVVFRFQFLPWFSGRRSNANLKRAHQKKLAECPEIPKSTILLKMFFFFPPRVLFLDFKSADNEPLSLLSVITAPEIRAQGHRRTFLLKKSPQKDKLLETKSSHWHFNKAHPVCRRWLQAQDTQKPLAGAYGISLIAPRICQAPQPSFLEELTFFVVKLTPVF